MARCSSELLLLTPVEKKTKIGQGKKKVVVNIKYTKDKSTVKCIFYLKVSIFYGFLHVHKNDTFMRLICKAMLELILNLIKNT